MNAVTNGGLAIALKEVRDERQNDEMESLRLEARNAILQATLDGRLIEALNEAKQKRDQHDELEELRMEARSAIQEACADGRLRALCQEMGEKREKEFNRQEVEALRLRAKKSLQKGLQDGTPQKKMMQLGTKVDAERTEKTPIETMRLQMRDLVMRASADGVMDVMCPDLETSDEAPAAEDISDEALIAEELSKDDALVEEAEEAIKVAYEELIATPLRQLLASKSRRRIIENPTRDSAQWHVSSTTARSTDRVGKPLQAGSAMMMDLGAGAAFRPPTTSTSRLASLGKGLNHGSSSTTGVKVIKANPFLQPLTSSKSTSGLLMPTNHAASTNVAGSIAWSKRMSRKSLSVGRLGAVF
jgi:hypothetical protein